jgi:hypothetical protein
MKSIYDELQRNGQDSKDIDESMSSPEVRINNSGSGYECVIKCLLIIDSSISLLS